MSKEKLRPINRAERIIVKALLRRALARGYYVAIDNGGDEYEVPPTNDYETLCKGAFHTDEERFVFRKDGRGVGSVYCIYGEYGYDVICDHHSNKHINELVGSVERLSSRLENILEANAWL